MRARTNALGYIRVSRYKSDKQVSPESQRARLEAYCETRGLKVSGIFEDLDVSGATFDRPGWEDLVAAARPGDVIVCNEFTRIGRNLRQTLERIEALHDQGVEIISLEQDLDTTTPAGKLQYQILLVIAEYERSLIRERVRQTQDYLAQSGRWHGGPLPYGYRYEGKVPNARVVVDEHEAEAVRLMYKMRAGGNSVKSIVKEVNRRGYLGKQSRGPMSPASISRILRNPSYIGERRVNGETLALDIPRLVERDLWQQVQNLWSRDRGTRAPKYLLSGLARCGLCGGPMGHQHNNYVCINEVNRGNCRGVCVREHILEGAVLDPFFKRVEDLGYKEAARKARASARPKGADLDKQMRAQERKFDRLLNLHLEGQVDPETFERNAQGHKRVMERLQKEKARRDARSYGPSTWPGDIREDWQVLNVGERREALGKFIESIEVRPGRGPGRVTVKWVD